MAGGLEAVAVGRAEAVVVVGPQRVGPAAEVLLPVVVLGLPGGLPVHAELVGVLAGRSSLAVGHATPPSKRKTGGERPQRSARRAPAPVTRLTAPRTVRPTDRGPRSVDDFTTSRATAAPPAAASTGAAARAPRLHRSDRHTAILRVPGLSPGAPVPEPVMPHRPDPATVKRAPARVLALRAVFRTVGCVAPELAARWAETMFCTPPAARAADAATRRSRDRPALHRAVRRPGAGGLGVGLGPTVVLVARLGQPGGTVQRDGARAAGGGTPGGGLRRAGPRPLDRPARLADRIRPGAPGRGRQRGTGPWSGGPLTGWGRRRARDPRRAGRASGRSCSRRRRTSPGSRPSPIICASRPRRGRRCGGTSSPGSTRAGTSYIPTIVRGFRTAALLIHDRGDPDVPFRNAEEIAAAWPGARVLATDGLGHRAVLRDPTVVARGGLPERAAAR